MQPSLLDYTICGVGGWGKKSDGGDGGWQGTIDADHTESDITLTIDLRLGIVRPIALAPGGFGQSLKGMALILSWMASARGLGRELTFVWRALCGGNKRKEPLGAMRQGSVRTREGLEQTATAWA